MSSAPNLLAHFLATLDQEKRSPFEGLPDMEELLEDSWQKGAERWPGVQVAKVDFATYLAERVAGGDGPAEMPAYASDLFLALGCVSGDSRALQYFESDVLSEVDPVLSRLGVSTADADEIRQELRVRLLTRSEAREAVLTSYLGTGSLVNWVRAVAGRQALMSFRRNKPTESLEEELVEEAFSDPVLAELKGRYRSEFKRALQASVGLLEPRERAIMRALVVDGRSVTEVAQIYNVHRVTASRWVSKIRMTLLEKTRARLGEELNLGDSEVQSVIRLIESQMEMSLARVLESEE